MVMSIVAPNAAYGGEFHWDVPRAIESVPVPGELVSLGVPLHLRAVRSELSAPALAQYFIAEFKRSELWVPPADAQFQIPGGVSLTALDTKRRISYTVIFQPNPDHTTTVILGEADLARRTIPKPPREVPLMPGAQHVLTTHGEGTTVVTYEVKATPDEVASFYRGTLRSSGFGEKEGAFVRGAQELRISADEAHQPGVLFISVQARGVSVDLPRPAPAADGGTR